MIKWVLKSFFHGAASSWTSTVVFSVNLSVAMMNIHNFHWHMLRRSSWFIQFLNHHISLFPFVRFHLSPDFCIILSFNFSFHFCPIILILHLTFLSFFDIDFFYFLKVFSLLDAWKNIIFLLVIMICLLTHLRCFKTIEISDLLQSKWILLEN